MIGKYSQILRAQILDLLNRVH